MKAACTENVPLYRSERSAIPPGSEGKENAQDRLFSCSLTPQQQEAAWSCKASSHRVQDSSVLHACRTHHKQIPQKQNLINSAVCPGNKPISTTAAHNGSTVCLRGRCLFQMQKLLCFFTEKPQIFFIRLEDLCMEQQMLEMKPKEPPASPLWLT